MDLIQQVKGYSNSREEDELDEEAPATKAEEIIRIPREEGINRLHQKDEGSNNLMNQRKQKLELMDLSLGRNNKNNESNFQQRVVIVGGCGSTTNTTPHDATCSSSISSTNNNEGSNNSNMEKEHMFDKVVTPSDVGKLNRLVIPKQHAEKYFPLDSSSNEKGLLLNFEDRNGKLWKFRYSYWNSSQSYVMTKGWSRFVKEKKLDSGDIVSFKRGVGDLYKHVLYIDWKRRLDHSHNHNNLLHDPSSTPLFLPNQYSSITWGGRLYSLPSPNASTSTMLPPHNNLNYNRPLYNTLHHQQLQYYQQYYDGRSGSGLGYLRSTPSMSMHQIGDQNLQERGNNIAPMIIDSVPVTHHHHHHHQHQQDPHHGGIGTTTSNAGKTLRLFGVNMECASSEDSKCLSSSASMANSLSSSSSLRAPYEDHSLSSPSTRGTSVLFDLDPSLQYKQ